MDKFNPPSLDAIAESQILNQEIKEESSAAAWHQSEAMRMVEGRATESMGKFGLITDIDNTFYRSWDIQNADYSREVADNCEISQYPIVFITGNHVKGVIKRIRSGQLPSAQVIIGSTGTEIAVLKKGPEGQPIYVHDEQFDALLAQQPFPRRKLVAQSSQIINQLKEQDAAAPAHQRRQLDFQDPHREEAFGNGTEEKVQPYKISFYFFANSEEDRQAFVKQMQEVFPDQKILSCEEVGFNSQLAPGETRKKYCLDVVAMTKAGAADYAIEQLGLEGGVLAGDSGNDDHLFNNINPQFVRILVGGAREEAKNLVDRSSIDRKTGQLLSPGQQDSVGFRKMMLGGSNIPVLTFKEPESSGVEARLGPQSVLYSIEVMQRLDTLDHPLFRQQGVSHTKS